MRVLLFTSLIALAMTASAEQADSTSIVTHINNSGIITVEMPAALSQRMLPAAAPAETTEAAPATPTTQRKVGYRIQVFNDNNVRTAQRAAQSRKRMIEQHFPDMRAYMIFDSPYWRVKVGDFRTKIEAETAIDNIKQAFPTLARELRIVRDRINATD